MQTRIHGIQTGMAVCYEFYFPKMWRKMAKAGTTLVLAPASWPKKHILQWRVLSAARAIENGICICAVNMAGTYKDVVLGGHSRFIDPLGHVLAEAGEGEEICYAEYDEEKYKDLGKKLSVVSGVVYEKKIKKLLSIRCTRTSFMEVRFFHTRFHQPMRKTCDTGVSFPVQAVWIALRGKIIFATIVVG